MNAEETFRIMSIDRIRDSSRQFLESYANSASAVVESLRVRLQPTSWIMSLRSIATWKRLPANILNTGVAPVHCEPEMIFGNRYKYHQAFVLSEYSSYSVCGVLYKIPKR